MFKAYILPAVAGAFLLGLATAVGRNRRVRRMCAMSLAAGKDTLDRLLDQCAASGQDLLLPAIRRP
jgi:hypothetical protein